MSTRLSLLEILNQNINTYLSGQQLAQELGLSRNAVWKAIKKLQEQGYQIETKSGAGYRLTLQSDILIKDQLDQDLKFPMKVQVHDVIDSTNRVAREVDTSKGPHLILANEQTQGRGRLGRSFWSPPGSGLYMTLAFRPTFGLERAMLVTTIAAVAVCRGIEEVTGLHPKIKWVNDIYLNGKKICGIMTEAQSNFETGNIDKIILGIGVNCFQVAFPEEIADIATHIEHPQKPFTRTQLAASIINHFMEAINEQDTGKLIREYKSKSFILGEQIMIFDTITGQSPDKNTKGIKARAIDIDRNGGLVVEYLEGRRMREMETITSGEISVRKV